jgi:uncharacterized protein (DUF1800 family)
VEAGVAAGGANAVIDQLLARPTTGVADWAWPADQGNNDDHLRFLERLFELWAWNGSVVQERVSWILSGMVVAGLDGVLSSTEMRDHHNRLRSWPAAASYKSMLQEVANSATMQKYLNGIFSQPPHPNENLARELMELFSLGVTNPKTGADNYTETDIKEIARSLTGYRMDWTYYSVYFDDRYWDAGNKTFLGAARGAAKLPEVMNAIASHDSFKYFVPQRLYRELMGFDPSSSALDQMASVWGANGNMGALVEHIAHRPEFIADSTINNRVKSPVELIVSTIRVLGKVDLAPASVGFLSGIMRQLPTMPPDVSGWDGNWLHPSHLVVWSTIAYWLAWSDKGPAKDTSDAPTPPAQQNPTVRKLFAEGTRETAADMALKLAGLHNVSSQTRSAIDTYARHVAWQGDVWSYERACGVMQMVFISPEFLAN